MEDSTGRKFNDLNLLNPDCDSYGLWVRFKIPLEVIVRDCSGYLYCLKSFITELVHIPLTARIKHLGASFIYSKVRVRLCFPNHAEAVPMVDDAGANMGTMPPASTDCPADPYLCNGPTFGWRCMGAIANNHWKAEQAENLVRCLFDEEEEENGCTYQYTFGTYPCVERENGRVPNYADRCANGNPKLDILVEACIVRLIAGGSGGDGQSPYVCYKEASNNNP
ncbi:hypothetical protein AGMMS49992_30720 [Clostridia bacterium]|nr:hypothetical protein AGMMS49992_30720 [Clostridia bacterium]